MAVDGIYETCDAITLILKYDKDVNDLDEFCPSSVSKAITFLLDQLEARVNIKNFDEDAVLLERIAKALDSNVFKRDLAYIYMQCARIYTIIEHLLKIHTPDRITDELLKQFKTIITTDKLLTTIAKECIFNTHYINIVNLGKLL